VAMDKYRVTLTAEALVTDLNSRSYLSLQYDHLYSNSDICPVLAPEQTRLVLLPWLWHHQSGDTSHAY
jgi:hypothetical protein